MDCSAQHFNGTLGTRADTDGGGSHWTLLVARLDGRTRYWRPRYRWPAAFLSMQTHSGSRHHHRTPGGNVQVEFPCKVYDGQLTYTEHIVKALESPM